jgi:hypothetical protein
MWYETWHRTAVRRLRSRYVRPGMNIPADAGATVPGSFVEDGKLMLRSKNVSVTYAQLLTRNELTFLVGDGNYDPAAEGRKLYLVSLLCSLKCASIRTLASCV